MFTLSSARFQNFKSSRKKYPAALTSIALITLLWVMQALSGLALAEVRHTSGDDLQALIDSGVPVIDVRRDDEWIKTGILPDSHPLTFFDKKGRYDVESWLSELEKIVARDEPLILICAVGGRTSTITKFLDSKLGFKNVYNVRGGIKDWIKQGRPVVTWSAGVQ